ncbi:hypothetical protein L9F63_027702 [Diploptera punctata]|uniref:Uncharacterized protein n=1 Tax=Diploptera punctata TaxID=6984 RepID=A0AAD8A6F8_DIPPU|nr:hypothetical protein L9F63_027702 [Diploptera punctata]
MLPHLHFILIVTATVVTARSLSKRDITAMSFPDIEHPTEMNIRMKNVARQVYLAVKTDDQHKHTLTTKTLNSEVDPEVDFSLYFYTSAESGETKLVLPVHQSTKVCFSMSDKMIKISSLLHKMDTNELDEEYEDPLDFTKADNRFFYIKKSGDYYALEAMDGVNKNYFLSLNESNMLELKEVTDSNYPDEVLFSIN